VFRGELDDALAPRSRERPAARVLERRNRVDEARRPRSELASERIGVEPLVVHRQRHDFRAEPREDLQRPVVGGRLDEHAPGSLGQELLRVEDEALEAAIGEEDPARIDFVPTAEPLPQRRVTPAGAVGEHRRVAFDRRAGAIGEQLRVEALRGGRSAGERDHARHPRG
jgi:hypothetical protein